MRTLVTALTGTLALVACGSSTPQSTPERWVGTGLNASTSYNVSAELNRNGSKIVGTYKLSGVYINTGAVDLTVSGTNVAGTLSPNSACTYDAAGTMTETQLNLAFTVRSCVGGANGTWVLLKQ